MQLSLEKLTVEELDKIINDCGDYHELKDFLNNIPRIAKKNARGEIIQSGADVVLAELNKASSLIKALYNKRFNSSRSFANALADAQNFPMLVLPMFLGIASIAPSTLAAITNALGLILLGTGVINFAGNYFEYQKNDKHDGDDFIYSLIKLCCSSILLNHDNNARRRINLVTKPYPDPIDILTDTYYKFTHYNAKNPNEPLKKSVDYKKKNLWPRAKAWLGGMFPIAMASFSIYCFGYGAAAGIFGLATSVALGPIGIVAAIGVSLGIGMFFGYKSYRAQCNTDFANKVHRQITIALDKQKSEHENNLDEIEKAMQKQEIKLETGAQSTQNLSTHSIDYLKQKGSQLWQLIKNGNGLWRQQTPIKNDESKILKQDPEPEIKLSSMKAC